MAVLVECGRMGGEKDGWVDKDINMDKIEQDNEASSSFFKSSQTNQLFLEFDESLTNQWTDGLTNEATYE